MECTANKSVTAVLRIKSVFSLKVYRDTNKQRIVSVSSESDFTSFNILYLNQRNLSKDIYLEKLMF